MGFRVGGNEVASRGGTGLTRKAIRSVLGCPLVFSMADCFVVQYNYRFLRVNALRFFLENTFLLDRKLSSTFLGVPYDV